MSDFTTPAPILIQDCVLSSDTVHTPLTGHLRIPNPHPVNLVAFNFIKAGNYAMENNSTSLCTFKISFCTVEPKKSSQLTTQHKMNILCRRILTGARTLLRPSVSGRSPLANIKTWNQNLVMALQRQKSSLPKPPGAKPYRTKKMGDSIYRIWNLLNDEPPANASCNYFDVCTMSELQIYLPTLENDWEKVMNANSENLDDTQTTMKAIVEEVYRNFERPEDENQGAEDLLRVRASALTRSCKICG